MKRLIQLSILGLTLSGGYLAANTALANPGQPTERVSKVERLTEHLGLDQATAEDVVEALKASREQKKALRESVKADAQALKSALDAGDEGAMLDAMANLESAKAEMQALKEETAETLKSLLTVEQQAKLTLHHLRKKRRAHQSKRRMQPPARP